jgi:hypothetical protein
LHLVLQYLPRHLLSHSFSLAEHGYNVPCCHSQVMPFPFTLARSQSEGSIKLPRLVIGIRGTSFHGGVASPTQNPQPGGPGLCIYNPRGRVAQLYPQALGASASKG